MIIVTVLYPKTADSRFDIDYYLQKHTPLVKSRWSALGLTNLDIMQGTGTPSGGPPNFEIITQLHFSSVESLQTALSTHGAEIMGDIANFTNVQPLIQVNQPI